MSLDASIKLKTATKSTQVEKRHKCDTDGCNKSFVKKFQLKRHKISHLKGTILQPVNPYKCDEVGCEAKFFLLERLKAHKLAVHYGERPFKCNFEGCDKSYKTDAHLKRHKATSHSMKECTSEEVMCNDCGNTYSAKYVLIQHIASTHTPQVDNGNKKKSDIEKRHVCDEPGCNAAFRRPYRLKYHKLTVHGNDKLVQCDYPGCDKSYTNESHLARHKTITHYLVEENTGKEVLCKEEGCGRIFANKFSLKKHLSRVHLPLPFSCADCEEKFKRKSQLHAHNVEIHNKEAPYKCNSCPRTFVHLHLYNKHLTNHKTYQCDCEQTFDKWTKFLEHRRTECTVKPKEHKCVICDKTFALKHKLTQHSLNVHVADSQLIKCPYVNCNRLYKQKNSLRDHIRTFHENNTVKIIKCTEKNCDVVLKSNRNLKQHLRIVHRDLPVKVRKPRKPRKDKGKPKKSMASLISGVEVAAEQNYKNIMEDMDENLKAVKLHRSDKDDKFNKVRNKTEDHKSRERIINNTKVKDEQAEERDTDMHFLEDCQETRPVVVKSLPTSNFVTTTEVCSENRQEASSFSVVCKNIDVECLKISNALEEPTNGVADNKQNQKNSENASANEIEGCGSDIEEIDKIYSKTSATVAMPCNDVVVNIVVDSESLENSGTVEIPSNETINDCEINNMGKNDLNYKSVTIVASLQSNVPNVQGSMSDINMTDVQSDNLLNVNSDSLLNRSQNNCDSGVVIFDFPEFDTTELSNKPDTINKEANVEEQSVSEDPDFYNDGYVPVKEKL